MKSQNGKKYILMFLFILLVLLSFMTLNKTSYAYKDNTANKDDNSRQVNTREDEQIFNFLKDVQEPVQVLDIYRDVHQTFVTPKEIIKEDPVIEIKKNESLKGKAKETTAQKDVLKYETNETSLGIDVSSWQGIIDWKEVKKAGINFAMIRCGFRGMDSGEIILDQYFKDNIKGAIANNINVGVYFFSMARTREEAIEEAKWVIDIIKDYDISYPVAIDTEIFNSHRLVNVDYSTLTNNALAFCNYIKSKGYTPMIYSYANAFNKYFDTAKFNDYRIWLAQYNDENTYKGRYHMWQYTSSGNVPGIKGRVDMNVSYFSVTNDATKRSIVNGVYNPGNLEEVVFKELAMDTVLIKDVVLRISPYLNLPNKAGTLEKDTAIKVIGLTKEWVKILYNDNIYYINDVESFKLNLEEVIFEEVNIKAKVNKEVVLLYKPYDYLNDNEGLILKEGEEILIIGLNDNYIKILKDEEYYYIKDNNFYDVIDDDLSSENELDSDVFEEKDDLED